jgi:hypothetical protein
MADEARLRGVTASITGHMTKLAETLLLVGQDEPIHPKSSKARTLKGSVEGTKPYFVRLILSGRTPKRFQESTTLPTFLEWNKPCICRVPQGIIQQALTSAPRGTDSFETAVCKLFGSLFLDALLEDLGANSIAFRAGRASNRAVDSIDADVTYVDIGFVYSNGCGLDSAQHDFTTGFDFESRHFRFRRSVDQVGGGMTRFVELSVAKPFPWPLSRQQTILSSEYVSVI